jgi:2-aminobenzoate-CoA ligase
MIASAHVDTFARDNLPPAALQPGFVFDLPELQYPDRMNACVQLLDKAVERGLGAGPCIITPVESLTYVQLL